VGLLAEIKFGDGSMGMPDASGSQLRRVAAWAQENDDGLVVLDGFADRAGQTRGNIGLSLRRARLVRDQLIGLGVDPDQIVVTAFGAGAHRFSRVTIWGTQNSVEQVFAARSAAEYIRWGAEPATPGPTLAGRR
jgi:outer membrane protein OmpA-like peptidoglycan-associated protein